jgi:hypothetical protein
MSDAVKAALREAAKALCICDGECFETRHGMMNDPCEAMLTQAAAAVAAFHNGMAAYYRSFGVQPSAMYHDNQAAAVTRAAQEDKR